MKTKREDVVRISQEYALELKKHYPNLSEIEAYNYFECQFDRFLDSSQKCFHDLCALAKNVFHAQWKVS